MSLNSIHIDDEATSRPFPSLEGSSSSPTLMDTSCPIARSMEKDGGNLSTTPIIDVDAPSIECNEIMEDSAFQKKKRGQKQLQCGKSLRKLNFQMEKRR